MPRKNYYKILGIESTAAQEEIKAAYRKLVRQYHPDKNPGKGEYFKLVQEAYETLSDERKRDHYDAQLAYDIYTSDPEELAKFLNDQRFKPKKYKPPVFEEEEEPREKNPVFNSTVALIAGIVLLIAGANVVILRDKFFADEPAQEEQAAGNYSNYAYDASNPRLMEEYFQRAMKYFHEKNYEFAQLYFGKAMEVAPNEPKLYFNRGLTHYAARKFAASLDDLNKTIQLNPAFRNAHWIRAKLKYDMDDNAGAIADFTEAIRLDPGNDSLYFNRGLAYFYTNDYPAAIKDIDKAIQLNPNQPQYYFDRGDVKEMAGDEDGTCSDWLKAKEMGYISPELNKKPCLSGLGS